jgi:hypothetical protein
MKGDRTWQDVPKEVVDSIRDGTANSRLQFPVGVGDSHQDQRNRHRFDRGPKVFRLRTRPECRND